MGHFLQEKGNGAASDITGIIIITTTTTMARSRVGKMTESKKLHSLGGNSLLFSKIFMTRIETFPQSSFFYSVITQSIPFVGYLLSDFPHFHLPSSLVSFTHNKNRLVCLSHCAYFLGHATQ